MLGSFCCRFGIDKIGLVEQKLSYCISSSITRSNTTTAATPLNTVCRIISQQRNICTKRPQTIFQPTRQLKSNNIPLPTMPNEEKPKVVFVLGGPGAGKGTQCSKIVDAFKFVHLSAGDLLREERMREGSEYGQLIEECIIDGKIVPVEITCSLLEAAMKKSDRNRFLIDGFPRNQDNLTGWTKQMADKVDMQFVLFFNCPEEVCVERCLTRGAGGSGRSDDNLETLKKRIQTYNNDSLPIIKHYEGLGQVKQIDACPDADGVFAKVEEIFQKTGF